MKNVIFTIKPQSVIDIITNSSSELFVGTSQSKELIEALIKEIYPDYLLEYWGIKNIDELDIEQLDTYFSSACSPHQWPATKEMYPILPGFTFEELYEPEESAELPWNKQVQYRLKNNDHEERWGSFVTEENIEEIKNKLDPRREMYFLFSLHDNPDWEYQEKIEEFMSRYHLG